MARPPERAWLEAEEGPRDLPVRVSWWREREAALRRAGGSGRAAPAGLLADGPGPETPQAHGALNTWLPLETLRSDVHEVLDAWFAAALADLGVDLDAGALGQARSWLEVRAWLPSLTGVRWPSEWLERLADPQAAHDLTFELFAPPRLGAALGRYPRRLARLVALAPEPEADAPLRVWDAGCATGEGTWELALGLAGRSATPQATQAVGTTPWPLERLMAERRARPHDPAPGAALAALLAAAPDAVHAACRVTFALMDLRAGEAPGGPFDLVLCHGVLGGALDAEREGPAALERLAGTLAPGGLLSVTDRFRADLSAAAARQVAAAAACRLGLEGLGLEALEPGLLRRPPPRR